MVVDVLRTELLTIFDADKLQILQFKGTKYCNINQVDFVKPSWFSHLSNF